MINPLQQTFQITFNTYEFFVDPILMLKNSTKFKGLCHRIHDITNTSNLHLVMTNVDVDIKSLELFLNLCQEIPTSVPPANLKDICELAKVFETNDIYEKYIQCVHDNIDPEFNVPDNKYDSSSGNVYLHLESKTKPISNKHEENSTLENESNSPENRLNEAIQAIQKKEGNSRNSQFNARNEQPVQTIEPETKIYTKQSDNQMSNHQNTNKQSHQNHEHSSIDAVIDLNKTNANHNFNNDPHQFFFSNPNDMINKQFTNYEEVDDPHYISTHKSKAEIQHSHDDTFAFLNEALSKHTESHHPVSFSTFSINEHQNETTNLINQSHNSTIPNDITTQASLKIHNQNSISNNNKINSTTNLSYNPNELDSNQNQVNNSRSSDIVNSSLERNDLNIQDHQNHVSNSAIISNPTENDDFSIYKEPMINPEQTGKVAHSNEQTNITQMMYEVWIRWSLFQHNQFYLVFDGEIFQAAKEKKDMIVICRGVEAQFENDARDQVGNIIQSLDRYNTIQVSDQSIILRYICLSATNENSIALQFKYQGYVQDWSPIDSVLLTRDTVSPLLLGQSNHMPIESKKNTVLQDQDGRITFVMRKKEKYIFEIECDPELDPTLAFAFAISQIVGPYSADRKNATLLD